MVGMGSLGLVDCLFERIERRQCSMASNQMLSIQARSLALNVLPNKWLFTHRNSWAFKQAQKAQEVSWS